MLQKRNNSSLLHCGFSTIFKSNNLKMSLSYVNIYFLTSFLFCAITWLTLRLLSNNNYWRHFGNKCETSDSWPQSCFKAVQLEIYFETVETSDLRCCLAKVLPASVARRGAWEEIEREDRFFFPSLSVSHSQERAHRDGDATRRCQVT